MAVKHGVFVYENDTPFASPINAEDAIVVLGMAPTFMVEDPAAVTNVPILCSSATEAMETFGYCTDFEQYTLCQMMYLQQNLFPVRPVVYINVWDPNSPGGNATTDIENFELTETPHTVKIAKDNVVNSSIELSYTLGDTKYDFVRGEHFVVEYGADFRPTITIIGIPYGDTTPVLPITVNMSYKAVKPSSYDTASALVTLPNYQKIIGSYNAATGEATGAELIQYVFPKLNVVPSIIIAPKYSAVAEVGAALMAKAANINGVFKAIAYLDLPAASTGYTSARTEKATAGYTSPFCVPMWPRVKMSNGAIFCLSVVAAALTAYSDANNGGVPSRSPSNKIMYRNGVGVVGICTAAGAEILLNQDQATTVNTYGITTCFNLRGWRLWGSYTGAYPDTTDVKDMWAPVRRMFNWQANNFILTYFDKVDDPLNAVLVESIVDAENIRCSAFTPDNWAGAEIQYLASDNPTADLLAGKVVFRQKIAPYTPAQEIDNILSYDVSMLTEALAGLE